MSLNNGLHATIEFGFFGFLAVPILRMLQFFYEYFPNYGVAIIILTLLIRLFTFPLQYKSKSMKKMQKLQPELNKLKEKYQDNPQKMQAETMELLKGLERIHWAVVYQCFFKCPSSLLFIRCYQPLLNL